MIRRNRRFFVGAIALTLAAIAGPRVVAAPPATIIDLRTEAERTRRVQALRERGLNELLAARAAARAGGWPTRTRVQGRVCELIGLWRGRPVYLGVDNQNAAISTAADAIRQTSPYDLSGAGLMVGLWDGGAVRVTHQELIGRARVKDEAEFEPHATHSAGTLAAAGLTAAAKGMAPAAFVCSYDFLLDEAEMASAAAATPMDPERLLMSAHPYSFLAGWVEFSDFSTTEGPHWFGLYSEREDNLFGQYNFEALTWDDLCVAAPYYLPVKSAGNNRDDAIAPGTTFYYFDDVTGWVGKPYDPAVDPRPDGWDNGGFDTITDAGCAKNVLTVGAVNDAVLGGVRSIANGTMTEFSGWGPTDDGRIKPDVVGNGVEVFSANGESNNDYATLTGASQATVNVCGSALLLAEYHRRLRGTDMRAGTLKALLIHTADDLTTEGPDYATGWGLVNVQAAADQIKSHAAFPNEGFLIEDALSDTTPTVTFEFYWNATDPLRATLAWSDPAGPEASGMLDDPAPALVNDLDLRLSSPGGAQTFLPFRLNPADPSAAAVTDDNSLDNIEQVRVAAPPAEGKYAVTVTHKGALTGGIQPFSLVISGQTPIAKVVVSGGPLQFGDQALAAGPTAPLDVTLSNDGAGALEFRDAGIALTGAGASQFVFASPPSTATLAAGQSREIEIAFDPDTEGLASAMLTITTNDPANPEVQVEISGRGVSGDPVVLQFARSAMTVIEDAGSTSAQITFSRPIETGGASVEYRIKGGTATGGTDYALASSGSLTLTEGQTAAAIDVEILEDAVDEPIQTLILQLVNPSSVVIGVQATATVSIVDNDLPPVLQFATAAANVTEGNGKIALQLTLSGNATEKTVEVDVVTSAGSAQPGQDYVEVSQRLSALPPARTLSVEIPIVNDSVYEAVESLHAIVRDPLNATLGGRTEMTIRIIDDDSPPTAADFWRIR